MNVLFGFRQTRGFVFLPPSLATLPDPPSIPPCTEQHVMDTISVKIAWERKWGMGDGEITKHMPRLHSSKLSTSVELCIVQSISRNNNPKKKYNTR